MDITFLIGKYDEKALMPQLAQALAASKAAAAGADPERRAAGQIRSRVFVAVFMIVLGAVMIYAGLTSPAINRAIYLPVAAAAMAASVYMIATRREAPWGMEKPAAKSLLRSLNGIESAQKARVQLREDGMTISSRSAQSHADYAQIDAAVETQDLFVLRQGRSVTVVQKRDLVGADSVAASAALKSVLDCPFLSI